MRIIYSQTLKHWLQYLSETRYCLNAAQNVQITPFSVYFFHKYLLWNLLNVLADICLL